MRTTSTSRYSRELLMVFDESDTAAVLALFVRVNMASMPKRVDFLTEKQKKWYTQKVHKHLPSCQTIDALAKAAQLRLRVVFGTPHYFKQHYKELGGRKPCLLPKKAGKVLIKYDASTSITATVKTVLLQIAEVQSKAQIVNAFQIDKADATWFCRINKICDELDLFLAIQF